MDVNTGTRIQFPRRRVQTKKHRNRIVTAMHFVYGLGFYLAAGLCFGAAFVTIGVGRVLPHPMTFTPVARLFLFPGAVVLWPYVLIRWLRA